MRKNVVLFAMLALLSGGGVGGSMLRNPPCKVEAGTTITYDPATGRIAESDGSRWKYFAGSNLIWF